ncbi:unnamed protein product [Caenorhabditis brenneri]
MGKFVYVCYVTGERVQIPKSIIWVEIDGIDVGISWKETARSFCSIHVQNDRHIMLVYAYICNLYNASEEIYLKTDQSVYQFPSVKRSHLQDSKLTMEQLKTFYQYYPEQEISEMKCRSYIDSSGENVFMVRNFILRTIVFSIPVWECFKMFKGEHAYFENAYMSALGIVYVSKLWMERAGDGLKSMIFKPENWCNRYNVEELRREIRGISCGKQRKQEVYPYKSIRVSMHAPPALQQELRHNKSTLCPFHATLRLLERRITEYQEFPSYIFNCTDGIDIRRDTDGKMATITLFPDYVTFFVWD